MISLPDSQQEWELLSPPMGDSHLYNLKHNSNSLVPMDVHTESKTEDYYTSTDESQGVQNSDQGSNSRSASRGWIHGVETMQGEMQMLINTTVCFC